MNFKTVQKSTASSVIVKQIIKAIEDGSLKPEEKLPPERELGKMFGVGRSSVREAISVLVALGYLKSIQGKGTFVPSTPPQKKDDDDLKFESLLEATPIFDLMESRHILEIHAVKLAAERAGAKQIKKIQQAVTAMEKSGDDIKAFYKADLEFHIAVAEASTNVFIRQLIKTLLKQSGRYQTRFMATSGETKEHTIITAKKIVDLISQGAGEDAALLMEKHLSEVDASLIDVVLKNKK